LPAGRGVSRGVFTKQNICFTPALHLLYTCFTPALPRARSSTTGPCLASNTVCASRIEARDGFAPIIHTCYTQVYADFTHVLHPEGPCGLQDDQDGVRGTNRQTADCPGVTPPA
jgi:hypothetical protein